MNRPVLEFFEKPGCINNRKQKDLLQAAGFDLKVQNLLTHGWQVDSLREYFGELPLPQWFNPSAPRIKSEKIKPFLLSEEQALAEMVLDPLLIRRPLIGYGAMKQAGFDLNYWLPLLEQSPVSVPDVPADIETCPRQVKERQDALSRDTQLQDTQFQDTQLQEKGSCSA